MKRASGIGHRPYGRTVALLLFAGSTALLAQTGQQPVFRAGAVLVTVDAYPQKDGQVVEGLTAGDFEVLEDGKPQKVENFEFIRVEPARFDEERRDPNSGAEGHALAADPRNRAFVVYLDTYHVTIFGSHATRQPLVDALRRLLAPNDLFGVMTPKMRPTDLVFGKRVTTIEDQLARYWTWGERGGTTVIDLTDDDLTRQFHQDRCGNDWLVNDAGVRRFLDEVLIARRHEEIVLASLEGLMSHIATIREGRTAVLAFTAGWRLYGPDAALAEEVKSKKCAGEAAAPPPPIPGVGVMPGGRMVLGNKSNGDEASGTSELVRLAYIDDARRFRDLLLLANRSNVSFYPINPEGLQVFDAPINEKSTVSPTQDHAILTGKIDSLRTLATNTDGIAIVDTNDLGGGMKRIVNDMSAYYLLGYYSTNPRFDGRFRRIEVRMKRPGVSVKARRGYVAPNTEGAKPASSPAAVLDAAAGTTPAPVADALGVLSRLRLSADVFVAGAAGPTELALVAEIASSQMAAGKWTQGADVQAVVTDPAGRAAGTASGKIEAGARGVLMRLPLGPDASGPWQVAVKVSSGRDMIEDRATITKGPVASLLGDALMYRAAPGPRAPLRPVADAQFRRTERVHIEWPMLKPPDDRQARLLSRTGQPLAVTAAVTERELNNHQFLAVDVNLAPLGAGDYVIEVTAGATEKTERRLVAIRVVQ